MRPAAPEASTLGLTRLVQTKLHRGGRGQEIWSKIPAVQSFRRSSRHEFSAHSLPTISPWPIRASAPNFRLQGTGSRAFSHAYGSARLPAPEAFTLGLNQSRMNTLLSVE